MIENTAQRFLASFEARMARPWVVGLMVIAASAIGAWLATPHLGEAVWQDEAATLSFHASRGVVDPFLHYVSPNSHVAFTSLLAAWMKLFPDGLDVSTLRMLPLILFVASIPVTYAAAHRLAGHACAAIATLLFATSAVSENFATQLRGYGPSWLFLTAALYCALRARDSRPWLWGYLASSTVSVAMLPTNLYFLWLVGLTAAITQPITQPPGRKRETALSLLAIPLLALLIAYAGILRELISYAGVDFSPWTAGGLLWEWLRGSLSNLPWLVPLVGAAAGWAVFRVIRRRDLPPSLLAGLVLSLGFIALIVVMPNPPFPRTLAPFLPVWLAAVCAVGLHAARCLESRGEMLAGALGAIALGALLLPGPLAEPCRGAAGGGGKHDYDLCHQYFRDDYRPGAVLDAWAEQPAPLPIVSDFEGYHALRILGSPARIFEYRNINARLPIPPLIVAHSRGDALEMMARLGLDPARYRLAADTGYFKVFAPGRLPSPSG